MLKLWVLTQHSKNFCIRYIKFQVIYNTLYPKPLLKWQLIQNIKFFPRLFINLYKILHSTEITHAIVSELPYFKQISHAIFLFKLYIIKTCYLFLLKSNVQVVGQFSFVCDINVIFFLYFLLLLYTDVLRINPNKSEN